MSFEAVFAAIYLVQLVILVWAIGEVRRFVGATPTIADEVTLVRYKALARTQMYMALFVIALMVPGFVATFALVMRHGLVGLGVVLATNGLTYFAAQRLKMWEARARNLPVTGDALLGEYNRVTSVWVKQPLPDF